MIGKIGEETTKSLHGHYLMFENFILHATCSIFNTPQYNIVVYMQYLPDKKIQYLPDSFMLILFV